MVQQKDSAKVKQQRRDMAQLIEVRKYNSIAFLLLSCNTARWAQTQPTGSN